jgi:4-oxalocrotonate tautomerase
MLSGRSREQKRELAETFTREMARIAKCKPADIQIVFIAVERQDWWVGGTSTADKAPAPTS